jgi:hypothetical protein
MIRIISAVSPCCYRSTSGIFVPQGHLSQPPRLLGSRRGQGLWLQGLNVARQLITPWQVLTMLNQLRLTVFDPSFWDRKLRFALLTLITFAALC